MLCPDSGALYLKVMNRMLVVTKIRKISFQKDFYLSKCRKEREEKTQLLVSLQ